MYCKVCNRVIADGSTFCCFCGSAVPKENQSQRLFCTKCNCEYESVFPFCGVCGTKLIPVSQMAPPKPRNEIRVSNTFTIPAYGKVIMCTVLSGEIKTGDAIKINDSYCRILRMENLGVEVKSATVNNAAAILIDNYNLPINIGTTLLCEDAPDEVQPKVPEVKAEPVIITPPPAEKIPAEAPLPAPEKAPTVPTTAKPADVYEDDTDFDAGDAIMQINATSVYSGTKAAGVEILSGTIYIFADRIDTKSNISPSLKTFLKMSEIQSVSKSKYMHMWSSIVINLKNGDAYTLASASAGSAAIDRALQIINKNIQKYQ